MEKIYIERLLAFYPARYALGTFACRLSSQCEIRDHFFTGHNPRKKSVCPILPILFLLAALLCSMLGADSKLDYLRYDNSKKITVDDNLSFIYRHDPLSTTAVVKIFFKGGKRAEPAEKRGLAFLTASLAISIPDAAKIGKLVEAGSIFSADVQEDFIVITIECLSNKLQETLETLLEVIKKPLISSLRIDHIKENMESGQKTELDDPDSTMNLAARNAFFLDSGYGGSIYGDNASLKAVKKEDITDFYNKYFNAANMVVSIAADLDEAGIKEIVNKYFSGFLPGKPVGLEPIKAALPVEGKFSFKKEQKQTLLCFAALLPGANAENFALGFVLENILGKGIGSKLWQLRSTHELAYTVEADLSQFRDAGLLKIYLKTASSQKEKAAGLLRNFLADFCRAGLNAAELEGAKLHAQADFLRMIETKEDGAFYAGYFETLDLGYRYIAEFFSCVERITLEQLNAYTREVLKPGNLVEIVIGPE